MKMQNILIVLGALLGASYGVKTLNSEECLEFLKSEILSNPQIQVNSAPPVNADLLPEEVLLRTCSRLRTFTSIYHLPTSRIHTALFASILFESSLGDPQVTVDDRHFNDIKPAFNLPLFYSNLLECMSVGKITLQVDPISCRRSSSPLESSVWIEDKCKRFYEPTFNAMIQALSCGFLKEQGELVVSRGHCATLQMPYDSWKSEELVRREINQVESLKKAFDAMDETEQKSVLYHLKAVSSISPVLDASLIDLRTLLHQPLLPVTIACEVGTLRGVLLRLALAPINDKVINSVRSSLINEDLIDVSFQGAQFLVKNYSQNQVEQHLLNFASPTLNIPDSFTPNVSTLSVLDFQVADVLLPEFREFLITVFGEGLTVAPSYDYTLFGAFFIKNYLFVSCDDLLDRTANVCDRVLLVLLKMVLEKPHIIPLLLPVDLKAAMLSMDSSKWLNTKYKTPTQQYRPLLIKLGLPDLTHSL